MPYILNILLFLPLLAILVLLVAKKEYTKKIAAFFAGAEFFLIVVLWFLYDLSAGGLQFIQKYTLNEDLSINYYLAVDSITIFFMLLVSFLIALAALFLEEGKYIKSAAFTLFLLEFFFLGLFLSLDLLFFYIFWELTLIPLFLTVRKYEKRIKRNFMLYAFLSSFVMLLATLFVIYSYYTQTDQYSFFLLSFYALIVDKTTQYILFGLFLLALFFKSPFIPLQNWFKKIFNDSPLSGSIVLITLYILVVFYVSVRIIFPLFPNALFESYFFIVLFSIFLLLYATTHICINSNIKKFLYYSSFYYISLIVVYLFSYETLYINIAFVLLLLFALFMSLELFLIELIYKSLQSYNLKRLSLRSIPALFALFFMVVFIYTVAPLFLLWHFDLLKEESNIAFITLLLMLIFMLSWLFFIGYNLTKKQKDDPTFKKIFNKKEKLIVALLSIVIVAVLLYPKNIVNSLENNSNSLLLFMQKKAKRVDSN